MTHRSWRVRRYAGNAYRSAGPPPSYDCIRPKSYHTDCSAQYSPGRFQESVQCEGLESELTLIKSVIEDSTRADYSGALKGVFVMPALMQCLTARLAAVEQDVETSNKLGSLRDARSLMQSSVSHIETLDDVMSSRAAIGNLSALLKKAYAYTATSDNPTHKKDFDDLCNEVMKWASLFFSAHGNQEFERFFEKALSFDDVADLGRFAAECSECFSKLAEVHDTLAELLPVSLRGKGSQWQVMVEFGRGVLKILVQCRIIVEISGQGKVTEEILADVAGKQQFINDSITKMEPPLAPTLREAYQKWRLLSPIRSPAYILFKQRYAEAKVPIVEQVPDVCKRLRIAGFLLAEPPPSPFRLSILSLEIGGGP
jgi:hypothetical protein